MPGPIAEEIKYHEFLAALKPLLDLLNVTANEIHSDIHIGASSVGNVGAIKFNAVARAANDTDDYPVGQWEFDGLAARPHPFTELAWPITVEIV
jgi:hypothetical protein